MERDFKGRFIKKGKPWNAGKKLDKRKYKNMGFQVGDKNPIKNPVILKKIKKTLRKRCKRRTIYSIKITSLIHRRVEKVLGKPKICENCGDTTKKKYDWANISGLYKNNINDYIRLCIKCHRLYDYGKIKIKRNFKINTLEV